MPAKKTVKEVQEPLPMDQTVPPKPTPQPPAQQQLTPGQAIMAVNAKTDQIILQINKKLADLDIVIKTIKANQGLAEKDRDLIRREIKVNSKLIDKFLNIEE